MIPFHPLSLTDKADIQATVYDTDCRNCDLNFMNLWGWRFLYDTEVTLYKGWLLFRFKAGGETVYMPPVGKGNCSDILQELIADAEAAEHPLVMLGACKNSLAKLEEAIPGSFTATADRNYSDYIYLRERLATLSGKKLQPKRNHANRFEKAHPDYVFAPLTPADFDECLHLEAEWSRLKPDEALQRSYSYERKAIGRVFENWDALGGMGGTLRIGGRLVAFTYGAPINYDTFDVCVEKADANVEGAYAVINRDFARHIPPQYVYLNREEDLGIDGLRQAKLSYQPEVILDKYTVRITNSNNLTT